MIHDGSSNAAPFAFARLDREDFWRQTAAGRTFKEWHHFLVLGADTHLLVNFSLSAQQDGSPCARLVVLGSAPRWFGFVREFVPFVSRNGCVAKWGPNRLTISANEYRLVIENEPDEMSAELVLVPRARPMVCRNHAIAPRRRLHWLVYPMLNVTGVLRCRGRTYRLDGASAYHDHNWGEFLWGDDFAWDWAVVLPSRPNEDWAFLYSCLMNRARTVVTLEHLLAWRDGINVIAAEGTQLIVEREGLRREPSEFDLPPVMKLVEPRLDADVPARVRLTAAGSPVKAVVDFETLHSARVLIPSERDLLGATTIHEVFGRATVMGSITATDSVWEGRGVFEFMRS